MKSKQYTAKVNGDSEYRIELNDAGNSTGTINGENFSCDLLDSGSNRFHVIRDNKSYELEILDADLEAKTMLVKVNGRDYEVALNDRYDELLKSLGMDKVLGAKVNEMKAPMPGLVLDIRVSEGQALAKGEAIIVLEAMKMENILKSPADVTVKKIIAKKGNAVEKNQVLVTFE
jgi:acetyl/propionyl-CoA carboxylase alpha subunit